MLRPLGTLTALLGIALIPLGLAPVTAWFALPTHAAFGGAVASVAWLEGHAGRPARARAWMVGYLLVTAAFVAALELGARARDSSYWSWPWLALATWAWAPPLIAGLAGAYGDWRRARLARAAVRARHRAGIKTRA